MRLLITGKTRSGKSTALHRILAQALHQEWAGVVIFDGKGSELHRYADVDGVRYYDADRVAEFVVALEEMADTLPARYAGLAKRGLRKATDDDPRYLLVADEVQRATRHPEHKSAVRDALNLIAEQSAALGDVLILATQRLQWSIPVNTRYNFNVELKMLGRGYFHLSRDGHETVAGRVAYITPDEALSVILDGAGRALAPAQTHPPAGQPLDTLSAEELALATWALEENDGYLGLSEIQAHGGMGQGAARRLASDWERRGWLAKDPQVGNKRRATAAFVQRLRGLQIPQVDLQTPLQTASLDPEHLPAILGSQSVEPTRAPATLYLGERGSGKTHALKHHPNGRCDRHIYLDLAHPHKDVLISLIEQADAAIPARVTIPELIEISALALQAEPTLLLLDNYDRASSGLRRTVPRLMDAAGEVAIAATAPATPRQEEKIKPLIPRCDVRDLSPLQRAEAQALAERHLPAEVEDRQAVTRRILDLSNGHPATVVALARRARSGTLREMRRWRSATKKHIPLGWLILVPLLAVLLLLRRDDAYWVSLVAMMGYILLRPMLFRTLWTRR